MDNSLNNIAHQGQHHKQPGGGNGGNDNSKRQRISRACDRCRRKKVKCDGKLPVCSHCILLGIPCTYLDATKKRGPPKGYIEAIENRLHKMEELLSGVVQNNSNAASYVYDALRKSDDQDASLLSDSDGKLFGTLTISELKARTAQSQCAQYRPSRSPPPATAHATAAAIDNASPETKCKDGLPQCTSSASHCEDVDCAHNLTRLERGVGHLTLDPTGSLRYLGDSSGWYIINRNLVSSKASPRLTKSIGGVLRWPPITNVEEQDGDPSNSESNSSSDIEDDISKDPCAMRANKNVVPVPRNMPPSGKPPMPDAEEETKLLELYFLYVHPVFPIMYKSYFLERMRDTVCRPSPALMSAVFAAASTYRAREVKTETELASVRIQMAVHFQRAKLYLDEQYTTNNTPTVLTLLLMSVYEQGTMSTSSWLYSGMAIRKAYDLGLHRDVGVTKHKGMTVLSCVEAEVRQRAWWGCYIMDIMVSATLGRPTTIRDFTFDAPFPVGYGEDSDELLLVGPLSKTSYKNYNSGSCLANQDVSMLPSKDASERTTPLSSFPLPESNEDDSNMDSPTDKPKPAIAVVERMRDYVAFTVGESDSSESDSEMHDELADGQTHKTQSLGVYYLNLLHILGHILTEMYACKPNREYVANFCLHDVPSRTERLVTLDHELREWKCSLPPLLRYPMDDILALQPARGVYVALIHLVYYTAMILLHRPFISKLGDPQAQERGRANSGMSTASKPTGTGNEAENESTSSLPSHPICTLSAQMISLIGHAIALDSRIFIMPFLTFMLFTAGTMHLNNIIISSDGWIARRFLKRTMDVMSRLGAHWQASYKCYTMLNTLVEANCIGLDQVSDEENEQELKLIKERAREMWRMAHRIYENRHLYREHRTSTSTSASPKTSNAPSAGPVGQDSGDKNSKRPTTDNRELPSGFTNFTGHHSSANDNSDRDVTMLSRPQSAEQLNKGPDVKSSSNRQPDTFQYPQHLLNKKIAATSASKRRSATTASPAKPRTLASRIYSLRDSVDSDGNPIVPASPYSSIELVTTTDTTTANTVSTEGKPQLPLFVNGSLRSDISMVTGSRTTPSSAALGQFVPSLEFFANADFPLGIGGPNGQTSFGLPFGQHPQQPLPTMPSATTSQFIPLMSSGTQYLPHQQQPSGLGLGLGLSDTMAPQSVIESTTQHTAAGRPPMIPTGGYANTSYTTAAPSPMTGSAGSASVNIYSHPHTPALVVPNYLDFGGGSNLTSNQPQMTGGGDSSHGLVSRSTASADTPWKDYVNQVVRIFGDDYRATSNNHNDSSKGKGNDPI